MTLKYTQDFYWLYTKLANIYYRIVYEIDNRYKQVIIRYPASARTPTGNFGAYNSNCS